MSKATTTDEAKYECFVPKAKPDDAFPIAYNMHCVKTIDELKQILSFQTENIAFDTETTGLSPEECFIVGYSFCMDGKNAYYVPVKHAPIIDINGNQDSSFNLGQESLDLIYQKMVQTKNVFMFNMRFDVRMMEYHGFLDQFKKVEAIDSNETIEYNGKIINKKQFYQETLSKIPYFRYDMTKCNVIDVQAMVYLADTNIKYPSLKASEEWYLGWRGASFEETVTKAQNENAVELGRDGEIKNLNFFYLTPEEAYNYAAVDALGTYLLAFKTMKYMKEAKLSGVLDTKCLQPLTRFENETTLLDTKRLKEFSNYYTKALDEVCKRCYATAGHEFNIGSVKEKNAVLKELNITTGEKTSKGEMATNKNALQKSLEALDKNDPNFQFLNDLQNYATLTKQKTSYVDNILEMCETNPFHPNRLRFSYKTCEVPSGRLAAGGDKKNRFFAALNIQNITKPKISNWYTEKEELVYTKIPELKDLLDASGTLEECSYNGHWYYRIFGWVFSEIPFEIEGQPDKVVEAFDQNLNIRSTFLPDPGYYWVSIDFNAEELRIPALITKEPVWVKAFSSGGDIHKETAISIWGIENYDKKKRKMAKKANFGILYGMTAKNFAEDFGMTMDEGEEFVNNYKASLGTLFKWVAGQEKAAEKNGTVYTLYGRPRRTKWYFAQDKWSWKSFGKRTAVNTTIQGTGADILKLVLIRLFKKYYLGEENNGKPLTDKVRFKNTIHDEINYQIRKDCLNEILPGIMQIMRLKIHPPYDSFNMEVGLEIGNRWGQSVGFRFDKQTLMCIEPSYDIVEPVNTPKQDAQVQEEVQKELPQFNW